MAGVLIRMKLAILRRSVTGPRAAGMVLGALLGLVLAAGTVWLAALTGPPAGTGDDLLAAALAAWTLGWVLGPVLFGGGDETLRPEHFATLPLPARKLAAGLLAATFVGITPVVSLLALASLVVRAARTAPAAVAAAVPAVLLHLVLVVLLSRVASALRGQIVRSQLGAALSGLVTGVIMAVLGSVWVVDPLLGRALTEGFPHLFSVTVRALPSGWGVEAVAAVRAGHPLTAAGALAALAAADLLLLAAWSALLVRRTTRRGDTRASGRRGRTGGTGRRLLPATPLGGAVGKELRTWARDVTRSNFLWFALFYGVALALIPLLAGARDFLPWTGLIVVLWAAATNSNLYGADGTALWLTLVTPGAARVDVRARQIAWLLLTGPVGLACTVVFTALSGAAWAWPWALALTPAMLGGAAGVTALLSVVYLVPMADPHRRGSNPWENGTDFLQVLAALALTALSAAPPAAVLWLGTRGAGAWLDPLGVLVGVAVGVLAPWWLGRVAAARLERDGARMLHRMRSGPRTWTGMRPPRPTAAATGRDPLTGRGSLTGHGTSLAGPGRPALAGARLGAAVCLVVCWVPLFPQGVVPMVLKLAGSGTRSWFLALYLPAGWQYPVAWAMTAAGLALLATGLLFARAVRRAGGTRRPGAKAETGTGAEGRTGAETRTGAAARAGAAASENGRFPP